MHYHAHMCQHAHTCTRASVQRYTCTFLCRCVWDSLAHLPLPPQTPKRQTLDGWPAGWLNSFLAAHAAYRGVYVCSVFHSSCILNIWVPIIILTKTTHVCLPLGLLPLTCPLHALSFEHLPSLASLTLHSMNVLINILQFMWWLFCLITCIFISRYLSLFWQKLLVFSVLWLPTISRSLPSFAHPHVENSGAC